MASSAVDVVLGAGGYGYGLTGGLTCTSDKDLVQSLLKEFKKHGHHQIDTARIYSDATCEKFLGELNLADQGFLVDTKANSFYPGAHTADNIKKTVQESLTALNTKQVNIFYLHAPERAAGTPFEETTAALDVEYKKGHFKQLGLSNFTAEEVEQFIQVAKKNGHVLPTVYQGVYNLVARKNEKELFPVLRKHGIAFYAYSPLGGSFLTGEISKGHEAAPNSRFDTNTMIGANYTKQYFKNSLFEGLEKLKASAQTHGLNLQEIALRWIIHHSQLKREYHDAIITGSTKLVNLQRSLEYTERPPLPADVVKVIEEVWELVKDDAPSYHF